MKDSISISFLLENDSIKYQHYANAKPITICFKSLVTKTKSDKVRGYAIKTRMRPIKKKNLTQICPIWFVNG